MQKNSFLHTVNLFIRSMIFSFLMWTITIVQCFLCAFTLLCPLRIRYAFIVNYIRMILRILQFTCGINYKVEGLENIPKDHAGVILSKHQSTWETFFIPSTFYQPAIILKRELFWVPFFGWGLATIDPIAINRNDHASALDQIIYKGKKCLEAGRWILVFPEGTRIPVGQVGKYRLGGARLAVAAGAPVIPIAHNAGYLWPRRKFIKRPGTVTVVIGKPIETVNRTPEDVMNEAKNWIEETVKRIGVPKNMG